MSNSILLFKLAGDKYEDGDVLPMFTTTTTTTAPHKFNMRNPVFKPSQASRNENENEDENITSIFTTTTTTTPQEVEPLQKSQARYTPITPYSMTNLPTLKKVNLSEEIEESTTLQNDGIEDELSNLFKNASLQSFDRDDRIANKLMPGLQYEENKSRHFKPNWLGVKLEDPATFTPGIKRNNTKTDLQFDDDVAPVQHKPFTSICLLSSSSD